MEVSMFKKNPKIFLLFLTFLFILYECKVGEKRWKEELPLSIPLKNFIPPVISLKCALGHATRLVYNMEEFYKQELDPRKMQLKCDQDNFNFYIFENRLISFIGIDYYSNPRKVNCYLKDKITQKEYEIAQLEIESFDYPKETLSVDKKRVYLSKIDQLRADKEKKLLQKIYSNYIFHPLYDKNFISPLDSKITSYYGTARVYNNSFKSAHLGTDFRAAIGVKIPSSNAGRVVYAGDLFYTGNTVIINHGLGIFSMYGHLSEILVKKDDIVKQGQILGLSGSTGRVSGPHLHWGVMISNNWVDGFSLIRANL